MILPAAPPSTKFGTPPSGMATGLSKDHSRLQLVSLKAPRKWKPEPSSLVLVGDCLAKPQWVS